MIEFKCNGCGTLVRVSEDLAGKKGRCPKCRTTVQVPSVPEANEKPRRVASQGALAQLPSDANATRLIHNNSQKSRQAARRSPQQQKMHAGSWLADYGRGTRIAFGAIGLMFLALIIFGLWALVLHDTWEEDQGSELRERSREVADLVRDGKFAEGVAKYEELLTFVGDRDLENSDLREAILYAERAVEPAELKLDEQRRATQRKLDEQRQAAFQRERDEQRRIAERKQQEAAAKKKTPAFLKAAQPFAKQAARMTSLYRTGLSYLSFGKELGELSVVYDQAQKAPNTECNKVASLIDLYMQAAQNVMRGWKLKIESSDVLQEYELRKANLLPSQLLPELCAKQRALAQAIAELEDKVKRIV